MRCEEKYKEGQDEVPRTAPLDDRALEENGLQLFVRVHKGIPSEPDHFVGLSDDPSDQFVWCTTAAALTSMTKEEVFDAIGFERWYIDKKKAAGFEFSLIVFRADSNSATRATWDGIRSVAKHLGVSCDDHVWAETIRFVVNSEIAKTLPVTTLASLQERNELHVLNALTLRAFLYHGLGCRELFHGDGYTRDETGRIGVPEYLVRNIHRNKLDLVEIVKLS